MSHSNPYRKSYFNTQPDYLFPPYRSTVKRAPLQPLVQMPQTLSEITGPLFSSRTTPAQARITLGNGLLAWRRQGDTGRWKFSLFDFKPKPDNKAAEAALP